MTFFVCANLRSEQFMRLHDVCRSLDRRETPDRRGDREALEAVSQRLES